VQVFVNTDSTDDVVAIAKQLSQAVKRHAKDELKAFLVFIKADEKEVAKLAEDNKIDNIGFLLLKGSDDPALKGYKINTDKDVRNTVIVYTHKTVTSKFVNYDPTHDARKLKRAIAKACKQKPKAKRKKAARKGRQRKGVKEKTT